MTTGRTYQDIQKAIDDFEYWLDGRGIDFTKLTEPGAPQGMYPADYQPSSQALEALYEARDESAPNIIGTY